MANNGLVDNNTQTILTEMWQEVCRSGGTVSFRISSASMSPTLEVGDIVTVNKVEPARIRVGDILAFQVGQNVVVHRITGKSRWHQQRSFHHRGDAGGLTGNIEARYIIGKILSVKRDGHEISLDTPWFSLSNRVLGWRLHFVDTLSRLRPGILRMVVHQVLMLPWKICRGIFLRRLTGNE